MRHTGWTAFGRLGLLCGLLIGTAGCATVIAGTTQEVFAQTEPAGADCRLDKDGINVGIVRPTPGKVNLPRSKSDVIVSCVREGYEQSNEVLVSSFSGATVGNILLGGLVGIAVDAASGANNKYPERVTVVMTPSSFPNETSRDEHFAGIKSRIQQGANAEIKLINDRCSSTGRELCQIEINQIREARDKALADLDRKRLAAKIM
ncbi:MAG: hypothetical protein FJX11_11530 [Alphaproteobacteria bacterium]|nr:hypothetical protein [Alphaproteobacteria bacterium]